MWSCRERKIKINCIYLNTLSDGVSTIDILRVVYDLGKSGVPCIWNRAIMIVQKKIHK